MYSIFDLYRKHYACKEVSETKKLQVDQGLGLRLYFINIALPSAFLSCNFQKKSIIMSAIYIETQVQPTFISRIRRLSKSNFNNESESKSPRLDKMIAHVNLFDKTTKHIEEELAQQRANSLAEKRMAQSKPGKQGRPGMGRRESSRQNDMVPSWVSDLTSRPAQNCVTVTESEGPLSP